jgi:ribosomal protein S18 acetylase RimI-like enzyme
MQIRIREAEQGDCARMLELVQELAVFERAPQEVTVSIEAFRQSGFGLRPVWWAFVATVTEDQGDIQEFIAGFALYYIRYSTWKGERMYLEDILVTEKYRGIGIGKMLFEKLMEEAGKKNLSAITWQVLDWNESALRFYDKFGARYDKGWWNGSIEINQTGLADP